MDPSIYVVYSMGPPDLHCLHYGISTHTLFTNMDPLTLSCLWNGPIKLMLLTVWTRQAYDF